MEFLFRHMCHREGVATDQISTMKINIVIKINIPIII